MPFISANQANVELVKAVNSRVNAEASLFGAKKMFWRLSGWSIVVLSICIVISGSLLLYNSLIGRRGSHEEFVDIVQKALSSVVLSGSANGAVSLADATVRLAPGSVVQLDKSSTVSLAPDSEVKVRDSIVVAVPLTLPQPQAEDGSRQRSTKINAPASYFTVFKIVPYKDGSVGTGWRFSTAAQSVPTNQYCYYSETSERYSVGAAYYFAENKKLLKTSAPPAGFDLQDALSRCIWFD